MQNIAATVDILAKQLSVMDTKLDAITDKTTVMSKVLPAEHSIIVLRSIICVAVNLIYTETTVSVC
jgi:hypothetical protein